MIYSETYSSYRNDERKNVVLTPFQEDETEADGYTGISFGAGMPESPRSLQDSSRNNCIEVYEPYKESIVDINQNHTASMISKRGVVIGVGGNDEDNCIVEISSEEMHSMYEEESIEERKAYAHASSTNKALKLFKSSLASNNSEYEYTHTESFYPSVNLDNVCAERSYNTMESCSESAGSSVTRKDLTNVHPMIKKYGMDSELLQNEWCAAGSRCVFLCCYDKTEKEVLGEPSPIGYPALSREEVGEKKQERM